MSEKYIHAYRESRKDNAFVHWPCFTPSFLLDSSIEKFDTFDYEDSCVYALHSSFRVSVEGQHTILESLSTDYIVGICIPLISMSNYYNMSLDEYFRKREAQIEEIQTILDQNQLELPILETNTMTPIRDVNDYANEIQSISGSFFLIRYIYDHIEQVKENGQQYMKK